MTPEYVAGFFDGEGCVALYGHRVIIDIANTNLDILQRFRQQFGGSLNIQRNSGSFKNTRQLWHWRLSGQNAVNFLKTIEPFSVVKHGQIEAVLLFWELQSNGKLTEELQNELEQICKDLK